jgi:hypothetical protein
MHDRVRDRSVGSFTHFDEARRPVRQQQEIQSAAAETCAWLKVLPAIQPLAPDPVPPPHRDKGYARCFQWIKSDERALGRINPLKRLTGGVSGAGEISGNLRHRRRRWVVVHHRLVQNPLAAALRHIYLPPVRSRRATPVQAPVCQRTTLTPPTSAICEWASEFDPSRRR